MLTSILLALVLVFLGSGALAAALMMSRRARLELEQRVNLVASVSEAKAPPQTLIGMAKEKTKKFDAILTRVFAFGLKNTWGMHMSSIALLMAAAIGGVVMWLMTSRFFGFSPLPSIALSVPVMYFAPRVMLARQQKKAERDFTEMFPDAVDTIGRMLRAGLPISAAMRTVAIEASPPVNAVFHTIADQLRIGVPIKDALDTSSRQIGLPDFRFFAVAVSMQYTTGGNLSATLEILSDLVRKRRAMRLKARSTTGEIRITAYTLASIPLVTIGALLLIQPGYLTPLWTDPRGHLILAIAGVGFLLSYLSMRTMMRSVTND